MEYGQSKYDERLFKLWPRICLPKGKQLFWGPVRVAVNFWVLIPCPADPVTDPCNEVSTTRCDSTTTVPRTIGCSQCPKLIDKRKNTAPQKRSSSLCQDLGGFALGTASPLWNPKICQIVPTEDHSKISCMNIPSVTWIHGEVVECLWQIMNKIICRYVCIYIYIYVCVCICIYIYMYAYA